MRSSGRIAGGLALTLLLMPAPLVAAQESERPVGDFIQDVLTSCGCTEEAVRQGLARALEEPETLNRAVALIFADDGGWRLLQGLNVRFTTFRADDGAEAGLGLHYSYEKEVRRQQFAASGASHSGVSLTLTAEGNVAFDRDLNPRDFLDSDVSLTFFRSQGGAVRADTALFSELNRLEDQLTEIRDQFALDNSSALAEFLENVNRHLTTQVYIGLSGSASFETDQSFTQTQYVYGLELGLDLKAWNRESSLAQWNLFDWPMAAVRYLAGVDDTFEPRGSSYPTVLLELGLVDPEENDLRESLGEMGTYPRLKVETSFKSLVLGTGSSRVYLESNLRYYRELGASTAVEAADIEDFFYFAGALVGANGMYVSYSAGRLPFDVREDQVYELGFRFGF